MKHKLLKTTAVGTVAGLAYLALNQEAWWEQQIPKHLLHRRDPICTATKLNPAEEIIKEQKTKFQDMELGQALWAVPWAGNSTSEAQLCPGGDVKARITKTTLGYRVQYKEHDITVIPDADGSMPFGFPNE